MEESTYNTYLSIGWVIILKSILNLHLGGRVCGPNSSYPGYEPVVEPCAYDNKRSSFMKA
jgi:hypothetical protein